MNKMFLSMVALTTLGLTSANADFTEWSKMIKEKSGVAIAWAKETKNKLSNKPLSGKVIVCLAADKKEWGDEVISIFNKKYPNISVTTKYSGSGEIINNLNKGNPDECSVVSPSSSLSSLNYKKYKKDETASLFYSPLVMVSYTHKSKLIEEKLEENLTLYNIHKYAGVGWSEISEKHKQWGINRVAFTNPDQSNSGRVAVILKAYAFLDTYDSITMDKTKDSDFKKSMNEFWENTEHPFGSTSMLTEQFMVSTSKYTTIFTYENMVPTLLEKSKKELQVTYPSHAILNDHPVWVVSEKEEEKALALIVIDFFLSEESQKIASKYCFRPSHPNVKIDNKLSSFYKRDLGLVNLPERGVVEAILEAARQK